MIRGDGQSSNSGCNNSSMLAENLQYELQKIEKCVNTQTVDCINDFTCKLCMLKYLSVSFHANFTLTPKQLLVICIWSWGSLKI